MSRISQSRSELFPKNGGRTSSEGETSNIFMDKSSLSATDSVVRVGIRDGFEWILLMGPS